MAMYGKAFIVPTLPVSDLDRARRWYVDKLGFKEVQGEGFPEGAMFEAGDFRFVLYKTEAPRGGNTALSIMVDDFDGWVREMRSHGVVFEDYDMPNLHTENGIADYMGVKSVWFKDSEGNILNVGDGKAMEGVMRRAA